MRSWSTFSSFTNTAEINDACQIALPVRCRDVVVHGQTNVVEDDIGVESISPSTPRPYGVSPVLLLSSYKCLLLTRPSPADAMPVSLRVIDSEGTQQKSLLRTSNRRTVVTLRRGDHCPRLPVNLDMPVHTSGHQIVSLGTKNLDIVRGIDSALAPRPGERGVCGQDLLDGGPVMALASGSCGFHDTKVRE